VIMVGAAAVQPRTRTSPIEELIRVGDTQTISEVPADGGPQERLRQAWLALIALPLVIVHPVLPVVCVLLFVAFRRRRVKRYEAARIAALAREMRTVVDLLRVAIASGLTVQLAIPHLCGPGNAVAGDLGLGLLQAVQGVSTGERFVDGLTRLLTDEKHSVHIRPLISLLLMAERHGTPLAASLEVLSVEQRDIDRRAAEAAARRLPVRMLAPLITLLLPSFALLTVVPLLASGLRALRLGS
jgi:tight adherence protein C